MGHLGLFSVFVWVVFSVIPTAGEINPIRSTCTYTPFLPITHIIINLEHWTLRYFIRTSIFINYVTLLTFHHRCVNQLHQMRSQVGEIHWSQLSFHDMLGAWTKEPGIRSEWCIAPASLRRRAHFSFVGRMGHLWKERVWNRWLRIDQKASMLSAWKDRTTFQNRALIASLTVAKMLPQGESWECPKHQRKSCVQNLH